MSTICSSCFKEIDPRAKRCLHCGATWGWAHRASVAAVFIGLALSLISLMTIAFTGAVKLLEEERADLIGEFITVRKDGIHFAITNTGNRAATLYDVWVTYPSSMETCRRQYMAGSREIEDGVIEVIGAKETVALSSKDKGLYLSIPSSFTPEFRADHDKYGKLEKKCSIELSYIDYDQKTKQKVIDFPCNPQGTCRDDLISQSTRPQ